MRQLRVGLLAQTIAATGNDRTICRIAAGLESRDHITALFNTADPSKMAELSEMVDKLDVLVGLHAYHAGSHLVRYRSRLPYILVLGGTDANVMTSDPARMPVMAEALKSAKAVVCFTNALQEQLLSHFGDLFRGSSPVIAKIPQAVALDPSPCPSSTPSLHQRMQCSPRDHVFLLPASIRAVKDPEYLVDAMQRWHEEDPSVWLAVFGPKLEEDVAKRFEFSLKNKPGVNYLGTCSAAELQVYMRQCVATVNTSVDEGMCGAILEAMLLSSPVIARRNPGNEAIVEHGVTGFLFDTPQEFLTSAKWVVQTSSASCTTPETKQTTEENGRHPTTSETTEEKGEKKVQTLENSTSPVWSRKRSCERKSSRKTKCARHGESARAPEIVAEALRYVRSIHSEVAESEQYSTLLCSVVENSKPSS